MNWFISTLAAFGIIIAINCFYKDDAVGAVAVLAGFYVFDQFNNTKP